jgi:hypothetical protein
VAFLHRSGHGALGKNIVSGKGSTSASGLTLPDFQALYFSGISSLSPDLCQILKATW